MEVTWLLQAAWDGLQTQHLSAVSAVGGDPWGRRETPLPFAIHSPSKEGLHTRARMPRALQGGARRRTRARAKGG